VILYSDLYGGGGGQFSFVWNNQLWCEVPSQCIVLFIQYSN